MEGKDTQGKMKEEKRSVEEREREKKVTEREGYEEGILKRKRGEVEGKDSICIGERG